MSTTLQPMPEDWQRLLAVVAHPDDLEYGAASAIARWTSQGREVAYVVVTDGEAGIDALAPAEAAPVRRAEQRRSAELVGVTDVSFLGHPDGTLEAGPSLRRDLARHIRRFRPDIVLTATYDLTYGLPGQDPVLNQADHRAVGIAVLDAARDAANRWIFPELLDEGLDPWSGVSHVYVMGSNDPTHGVDVSESLGAGVQSLEAHRTYLDGLGRDFDAGTFLRSMTAGPGRALGTSHAVALGRIQLAGV